MDQTGEKQALESFKEALGFGRVEKKSGTIDAWRLVLDTFKNSDKLMVYFNQFPPQTVKLYMRFIRYQRIRNWTLNGSWRSRIADIRHLIELNSRLY